MFAGVPQRALLRTARRFASAAAGASAAQPPKEGTKSSKLRLGDASTAYQSKTTFELMHALMIFRICSIPFFANNSLKILHVVSKVFGERFTYMMVKKTMFRHFCAGEDAAAIKKSLKKLADLGIGGVLDYAAEAEVPLTAKKTAAEPDACLSRVAKRNDLEYFMTNEVLDHNAKLVEDCIQQTSLNIPPNGIAYAAVKITGICDPQLLVRVSALLLAIKRSWVRMFVDTDAKIEEFQVAFGLKDSKAERYAVVEQVVRGLKKQSPTITDAQTEAIIRLLTPASGKIDYMDFTRIVEQALLDPAADPALTRTLEPFTACIEPKLKPNELSLYTKAVERGLRCAKKAADLGVRLNVDAEHTYYQPAIDTMTRVLQRKYNITSPFIFNTYQCYRVVTRQRVLNDIARSEKEGFVWGAKMVRGAYMTQEREAATKYGYNIPILPDKAATDVSYNEAALSIMNAISANPKKPLGVMFGSHNKESLSTIAAAMDKLPANHAGELSFAQLLGMGDHLSIPLAHAGYCTFKYVPYGPVKETLLYLGRRAEENCDVLGNAKTEMALLRKELRRRLLFRKQSVKRHCFSGEEGKRG